MLIAKIRRNLIQVLSCILLLGVSGCGLGNSIDTSNAEKPNANPPSFMVDGILYYSTGKAISVEVDETDYLGKITSVVSISEIPTENGQANIPFEGAPYVEYENGFALLMDNEWIVFEARED